MYSFALILLEIATNKLPFANMSPMAAGLKVMYGWMDRWMGGWTDGWVDRWMNE
jgi:hypothetical protein